MRKFIVILSFYVTAVAAASPSSSPIRTPKEVHADLVKSATAAMDLARTEEAASTLPGSHSVSPTLRAFEYTVTTCGYVDGCAPGAHRAILWMSEIAVIDIQEASRTVEAALEGREDFTRTRVMWHDQIRPLVEEFSRSVLAITRPGSATTSPEDPDGDESRRQKFERLHGTGY